MEMITPSKITFKSSLELTDMEMNTPSKITFKSSFEDEEIVHFLNDADYLPNVMKTFARFLRASGWEYIGVRETEEGYLFHKDFSWKDNDEENMPDEVKEAEKAYGYWDKAVDEAFAEIDKEEEEVSFSVGDRVKFVGRGGDLDDTGYTGVPLLNKEGVVKPHDLGGYYILVEFFGWNDGHNGAAYDNPGSLSCWYCDPKDLIKVA